MAGKVSQEKAREIMKHGEVHGHALSKKQRGFFGARAGGAPMLKARNAPIFPDSSGEDESRLGVARWEEPLSGPEGATVGNPPGLRNLDGFYQNQEGREKDLGSVPFRPAGIGDSDFPDKSTFSKGTAKALDTGGLV